ncbi:MAG: molybdopterin dinucleotide binding domain-containing protein, partial [Planctomycetota bacterium]
MRRRDFLKLAGLAAASAMGCSRRSKLLPYLHPPEDIVPGVPTWYATTCRECPAGCGILAKCREGRPIKLEGNPDHPVNRGALCARGQAALHGLYHPERLRMPQRREKEGGGTPLPWENALALLREKVGAAKGKVAVLSDLQTGFTETAFRDWLTACGSDRYLEWEACSTGALREASRTVFGTSEVPHPDLSKADFILSLSCDFLETWRTPVEFARAFSASRGGKGEGAPFVYAGPRLSLTAASADRWVPVKGEGEAPFGFALLAASMEENPPGFATDEIRGTISSVLKGHTFADLCSAAGVEASTVRLLARRFTRAERPVALAGENRDAAIAAHLLTVASGGGEGLVFGRSHALEKTAPPRTVKSVLDEAGNLEVLIVHNTDPLFSLPPSLGAEKALRSIPFVVVLSCAPTETQALASLVLPLHHPLESWGAYMPREGLTSILQPVIRPRFGSKSLVEILDATRPGRVPAGNARDRLSKEVEGTGGPGPGFREILQKGFHDEKIPTTGPPPLATMRDYRFVPPEKPAAGTLTLQAYPSVKFFDGRGWTLPWLQEMPDPMTRITWGIWLEMHPDTAKALSVREGDRVGVSDGKAEIELSVHVHPGLHPDVVAAPLGSEEGGKGNPLKVTDGAFIRTGIKVRRLGGRRPHANTDGSRTQHGRGLSRVTGEGGGHGEHGSGVRLPLSQGYKNDRDLYGAHAHKDYRWGMTIDLDRCTGCGACTVACAAENNVAVVGREHVRRGREMAWLHVERFWEGGAVPSV